MHLPARQQGKRGAIKLKLFLLVIAGDVSLKIPSKMKRKFHYCSNFPIPDISTFAKSQQDVFVKPLRIRIESE